MSMPLFIMLAILLASCANCQSQGQDDKVAAALRLAVIKINETEFPHCYNGHSGTKASYLKGKYKAQLGGAASGAENTIVYPFCLMTRELGNKLGNYFTEIGCAEASGLHFISVHKQWDLTGSHTNITVGAAGTAPTLSTTTPLFERESQRKLEYHQLQLRSKRAFLDALPDVIVHRNPVKTEAEGLKNIQEKCRCTRYCWGESQSAWINQTASIRKYLRTAISAYLKTSDMEKMGTILSGDTDMTNAKPGHFLPLIPEVSLQYRCGDNIGFSYMYGVLPFAAFLGRIPSNATVIYVLSDHPSRAVHSPYSNRCQVILTHLFEFLKQHYPLATIVIKRGGDMFMDYARLAFANVTICSASTYCFWPAIASLGQAHFPLSGVIAGADTMEQAPNFGPNFHWIVEPKVISDFRKFRPWTNVLDVLKSPTVAVDKK